MAIDATRSTSQPTDPRRLFNEKRQCAGYTHDGVRCRNFVVFQSDYCRWHGPESTGEDTGKREAVPGSLPGQTRRQQELAEKQLQRKIQMRKEREAAQDAKAQQTLAKRAWNMATQVQVAVDRISEQDPEDPVVGVTKLRTIEDCLALIEIAIDEIFDQPPSLSKSKVYITAARTAGQLIIQAGVADKAVEWFQQNVKLVAGIDLDQV